MTNPEIQSIPVADHRAEIDKMIATLTAMDNGLRLEDYTASADVVDGSLDYYSEMLKAKAALREMRDLLPRFE